MLGEMNAGDPGMPAFVLMVYNITNEKECSMTFLAVVDIVNSGKLHHSCLISLL